MKLASLRKGGRDGTLVVVDRTLERFAYATNIAPTLQQAVESWGDAAPKLKKLSDELNEYRVPGEPLDVTQLASPLPRAYQWLDGSAYLTHVERVRKARGAEMPPSFLKDPLMYQGGSDHFIAPTDPIYAGDEAWGIDMESEVAIITSDVPKGVSVSEAGKYILLVMLVNDVSLRNLIPAELAKGFGFLHGKPPTAFSPVAVTPDELGRAWCGYKVDLPLITRINKAMLGRPNAGDDMQFDFAQLISHAAKTRALLAGTIIGSGTVSNADLSKGCSCLAERRVLELLAKGEAKTPFLKDGDRVQIEMLNEDKESIFGSIDQTVQVCQK